LALLAACAMGESLRASPTSRPSYRVPARVAAEMPASPAAAFPAPAELDAQVPPAELAVSVGVAVADEGGDEQVADTATPRPVVDMNAEWDPSGTLFGLSVANLGDLDGDGEDECAIGAPAAWGPRGRTGAVLIVGVKSGRLQRAIFGSRPGEFFGESLRVLPPVAGSKQVLLAVDKRTRAQIVDPLTGDAKVGSVARKNPYTLERDLDGDGVFDVLRKPAEHDAELVLVSGATGAELLRLPTENPCDGLFRPNLISADVDGDGLKDLAIAWTNFPKGTSKLCLYSGRKFQSRRAIPLGSTQEPYANPDRLWRHLHSCGDLNGDGCDDILAACVDFFGRSLSCYSGADGARLWVAPDVVDEELTSVVRVCDLDGDGVADLLCGRVLYLSAMGMHYGNDGTVFVLSGKTGRVIKKLEELDYPVISLENFLAPQGK
jgi:hypothetical protein